MNSLVAVLVVLVSLAWIALFEQATNNIPAVAEMLRKAQAVLGYDLLKLCLEGPKEQLDETRCLSSMLHHV